MPASTPQNIPNAKSRRTPISGSEPGSSDENQNHPCAPSARPSYADLLYISEHVTKWRKLMGYLLSDTQCNVQKEIEELEEKQHHKSLQTSDCTRQALEIWRQRKGSRATILDLFDVLVRIGRTDVKEGLEGRMGRQRSFPIGLNVGSTPHSSPLIGGAWRKISNDLEVPENEKILSLVNHPDVNFVSVAGTIGSGKTFVLENLARDFANKVSVAKRRIIKVSMEHPISVIEIAKDITANLEFKDMPISSRHDAKRQVKQALIPCLQSYDLVLLLLDLSLIPQCPHSGKPVLEFLYDLLQCENLSNLNIVVSSLCSMKGCKIFRDLKNAAVEIVMTELSYKRAVEFILSENDKFPEKCAVYLCNKYERSPQILKCIAQIDLNEWYDLPEDNEAELMKALESNEDECRECVSNNVEGKRHLENIFSCLTPDQKKTVTQCLVFRDDFDIDRAILVVDHEISISVGKLHSLESILLLRSKRSSENEKTLFAFPKIVGELLRNVVKEDRSYFSDYVKAEERFCRIYLDLLELLGQNFLGFIGEKRQEVKILAPLTPTASVPNAFLLSSQDADNRVRLLIKLFRDHETEIMQSLKLCVNHSQLHDRILNTACKLPVLSLMNKLLPLHVTITIYRKLKRMTEIRDDRLGMARINVCIAYYWMHSYGFQWFHGEATNLLEAAHEELFEHGADEKLLDDRANCISKLGRSFAAEGMQDEMNTGRILTGIELIKSGISKWENKIYQSVIDEVLIATNRRHIADVGSTPHSSPLIGGAWRKISNDLEVPENEKILSLVNHPDVNFVSVAGTIGSGKTFVLENLARDFANKVSVAKRRIIKVSMEHPISVIEIAKDITANLEFKDMPISSRHDAKRQVKQALIPCLQSYDLVLLLLDLSLIPQCPHSGKPVLEFLYDLLQCENLSNLNIVVSSLCSMKGCKIFRDLKNAAVEIVMTELSYKRAVEFILSENDKFPEKCAVYLCNKYERSPQILKCIAQIDLNEWYDLPEDNEAELMKALESNEDECRECVSNNVEGKRHLENIFSCLTPDQKKTVTQCLVFRDDFDIDRAILVVDHEISISVGKLHSLESILLLRSKRSSENEKTLFAFPKIVGELLRNVVKEDRSYFSDYVKAEERFCRIYLDLLELLGQNFLGFIGEKRQEVKILAPLTPTASVPNAFLLSSQDADNRVRLLIKLFRDHETEIMQSLKLCVNHSQLHDRILNTACKLPVLSLMNKLLPLHVTITIYRKLKRMTEIRDDRLGMARINVCIAYYWMHSYGFQWFHGEATNLLEAAHEELFEHGADEKLLDDRANCISKLGRSFAAEGMQDEMNTGRILTGIELIKSGISKWENKIYQSVIDEVLIATNRRHIAGAYHQIGMLDKAEQILTQKVQPVFQKYLGNSHPLTVNSFNTLGVIKRKKKHLQAAKEMLFKALELSKELLGDHGDTARLLHELGLCCVDEADQLVREDPEKKRLLKEAKMYFEDAAKVARKVVGDREITAGSFRKLLDVCKQLGESDEELHYIEAELQRIEPKLNKYLHEVRNTASVN